MAEGSPVDPGVVDLDVLRGWMDDKGLGSGELERVTALAGGTQNLLLRFERSGRAYVLRRPPEHKRANSDETMRREARVLAALEGSGVPHPALIAAEPDETVIGAAFYLMEAVDGFNPTSGLPAPHAVDASLRREMGFALIDAAAALGAVDHEAVGLTDLGRPEGFLERQVPRWWSHLETYREFEGYDGPNIPHLESVATWLEDNRPRSFVPGLMHGDFHLGNMMYRFDGPELAAVVDWELATIGDPLLDVGLVMAFWPGLAGDLGLMTVRPWDGFPSLDDMVDRYCDGTEREMAAIDWYGVLACYKTGIILEGTHARAAAGRAQRDIGDLLHRATVDLFRKARAIIEST